MSLNYSIVVDLGASGGKMISAAFDGDRLHLGELFLFDNTPMEIHNNIYWKIFDIFHQIKSGLFKYSKEHYSISSIGIDSWGASYGLLDYKDRLLEPVYHYRDMRTAKTLDDMETIVSKKELFRMTGTQCTRFYTLPQLYSCVLDKEPILDLAKSLLFIPDLLSFFLSGEKSTEITIAGTSSLLDSKMKNWNSELFSLLNLPEHFLLNLANAGSQKGEVTNAVAEQTGIGKAKVICTIGHDTAAAVCGIPSYNGNKIYVSIGSAIIVGNECDNIYLDDITYDCGFKNTSGLAGKNLLYKDFTGFWLVNELIKCWRKEGKNYNYNDLNEMIKTAHENNTYIDPEDERINTSNCFNMIENIIKICKDTGQNVPQSDAEIIKCIFESFAMKVKYCVDSLIKITGKDFTEVVIIGGGSKNTVLDQMIADATGFPVKAGSPYATLIGNVMTQFYALGELKSVKDMRDITERSIQMVSYDTHISSKWNEGFNNVLQNRIFT